MLTKRIILADENEEYIMSIQKKFIYEFFGMIELEIITEKNYFKKLFASPQKVDVLIISEELYDNSILRHDIDKIFILTEKEDNVKIDDKDDIYRVFKYSNIREIYGEILLKSESILKNISIKRQQTQIILVDSANGGTGKTTVALGISTNLAQKYKKVLYVNAANINTFPSLIECKEKMDDNNYEILGNKEQLTYQNIKNVIRNIGFDYLLPFSQPLMALGMEVTIYKNIIKTLKESKEYDFIIVDAETGFDEEKIKLIGMADKVLVLLKQNKASVYATEVMTKSISGIDSDKYVFVCNDYDENQNDAICDNQELKTKVETYIEHISDYDRKKCSEIAQEKELQKLSYLFV